MGLLLFSQLRGNAAELLKGSFEVFDDFSGDEVGWW